MHFLSNFGCKIIFMCSVNVIIGISNTPTHCLKEALITWPLSASGPFICISFMVYLTFLPFTEGILPFNTQYLWLAPTPTHFSPTPVYRPKNNACDKDPEIRECAKETQPHKSCHIQFIWSIQQNKHKASHYTSVTI